MNIRALASLIALCLAAVLASPAAAQVVTTPAGPIWNNHHAQGKCPSVCARDHMGWRGVWRTRGGMQSECDCVRGGGGGVSPWRGHDSFASGPGGSCHARALRQCQGCSVSCRPGQSAHCQEGNVGIFNGPNDTLCAHKAQCSCH